MVEQVAPNPLQSLAAHLAAALAIPGFNPFVATHKRHERRYTRAYADGRQKQGGGLYVLEQKHAAGLNQLAQPKPAPSAKARARKEARLVLVRLRS